MIIDIHTHTFPDRIAAKTVGMLGHAAHMIPHTDGTVSGLLASGKQAGIDLSVILPVATKPAQVEKINTRAAETNALYQGNGVFSLGAMHPAYEYPEQELERIASLGLKGIKIHPVYQGEDIDSPAFLRILRKAAELGLVVITHSGLDIGFPGVIHCSPQMCRHVKELIPDLDLVLAHMGGWWNWDEVPSVLADTGVYIDTAFSIGTVDVAADGFWPQGEPHMLGPEQFLHIIRAFGTDHVLFGTDCPWASQSEYMEIFRALPLTAEERTKILGENVQKLLQIT